MAGLSPTQRTLKELRGLGRICAIAEKWQIVPTHPAGGVRKDLFGFIDVISLDPGRGIVGIQSCGQNFAEHIRKILDSECTEAVIEWLKCDGKVEIWGWRKVKVKRGGKALVWRPRIQVITLEDIFNHET
jgi:hypothetical protein